MPPFQLSPAAKTDLKKIARYSEKEWGKIKRDEYLAVIDTTFYSISNSPLIGLEREELERGIRSIPVGKNSLYMIYYRIKNGTVEIVRILHHAMDVQRRFDA